MKTKSKKPTRKQLEQMYYHFFNTCVTCRDFMEFVPKMYLIKKIIDNVSEQEIKQYIEDNC